MIDWATLNPSVIDEFRTNDGRVAQFGDLPIAILHTIGARTGRSLEVPLIVVPRDGRTLIFATAAGAKKNPAWVHNLRAHPRIDVELGSERFETEVVELEDAEAEAIVLSQAEGSEQLARYLESAAPRRIPVFEVRRV